MWIACQEVLPMEALIWEPLSTWEKFFDEKGKSNDLLKLYDEISRQYLQTANK